jgi:hypothetical protein
VLLAEIAKHPEAVEDALLGERLRWRDVAGARTLTGAVATVRRTKFSTDSWRLDAQQPVAPWIIIPN